MAGRPRQVLVLVLLVSLLVAAPTTSVAATTDGQASTIHRTTTLSLTPDTPGEIAATATYDLPDNVRSLETSLPPDATVIDTTGFSRTEQLTYEWDGTTDSPSIRFTVPTNETTVGTRAGQSRGYAFVDTGPWALVAVPQLSTAWRYVGTRPSFEADVTVDGAGATGGQVAFLGPHRTVERTAHGQHFTLVVPEAASLTERPDAILDSMAAASDALRVGERDPEVFVVAAPTSVEWGSAGIEYGGSDAWVVADERLDTARNVWLHEYVHTRQGYRTTDGTRWTLEAGAEYHAALLSLQQRRIGFTEFRRYLDRGTRDPVADTVLVDPTTWTASTPYLKGGLVYGGLDYRLRVDSNGTESMQSVFTRLNNDPNQVTTEDLRQAVAATGTDRTVTFLDRYTSTEAVPDAWSRADHEDAFAALPALVSSTLVDLTVTGDTRETGVTDVTTVTTDETLAATVAVSNTGGANGSYETTLYVDETPVDTRTGTIAPGTDETVTLRHVFDAPGTYEVSVAGTTQTVTVDRPADPRVTELTVDTTPDGDAVRATLTVTVTNPTDRPASGSLPVTVDGTRVGALDVTLGSNESVVREYTTTLTPGQHVVGVGDTTASVDARAADRGTSIPVPGFGAPVALLAVLYAVHRRARR